MTPIQYLSSFFVGLGSLAAWIAVMMVVYEFKKRQGRLATIITKAFYVMVLVAGCTFVGAGMLGYLK